MKTKHKHVRPLYQLLIGIILVMPTYIFDPSQNVQLALDWIWLAGVILILSAIGNAIVSHFKRHKTSVRSKDG